MRQTMPVVLTDEDREELKHMEGEIVNIIESETCPPFEKKRICKYNNIRLMSIPQQ